MTVGIDDDAVINNVIFTDQSSNPATPAAGKTRVFTKSNGLYIIDDDGDVIGPFITGTTSSNLPANTYVKVLLSDTTISTSGTVDVSSISQDYTDLEIIIKLRGNVATTGVAFQLSFNNDTTDGNYQCSRHYAGNNGGSGEHNYAQGNTRQIMAGPAGTSAADYWLYAKFLIPLYTGNANKIVLYEYNDTRATNQFWIGNGMLHWLNTAAINRVLFDAANADINLASGSRVRIFGWKSV